MRAATEEFLYFLLWTADGLARPTWRNLNESFETWAYRTGLGRRLQELERQKILERDGSRADTERVYRLTEAGRKLALRGIDPMQSWSRHWDGIWRMAVFDVPETQNRQRVQLRRSLRAARFGYLQRSVWVSPDPADELRRQLKGCSIDVECLTLFEGRPCGGESDGDVVAGAWDFAEINRCYEAWSRVMDCPPKIAAGRGDTGKAIRAWAANERLAWRAIVSRDPFLPAVLCPENYPGQSAWRRRQQLLTDLGRLLSSG